MVIEALVSPVRAEKRPSQMILLGIFYTSLAMGLAYIISPTQSSMIMVFLTVMACMPIVYNTIKYEEEKDEKPAKESWLLKEHAKALEVFIFLFLGMVLAFSFWGLVLPDSVQMHLFRSQADTMLNINGNADQVLENEHANRLILYLANNLRVLFFCVVFSFIYGLGALFILTWNASIVGYAISNFIMVKVQSLVSPTLSSYLHIYSCGYFVRYLPHGIPEMLAYFIAGLAGGIISVAVIRHQIGNKRFMDIVVDSADLFLIAFAVIVIAGLIEVFGTPHLMQLFNC